MKFIALAICLINLSLSLPDISLLKVYKYYYMLSLFYFDLCRISNSDPCSMYSVIIANF